MLADLNRKYLNTLENHPLATKVLTAAVLNGLNEQLATYFAGETRKSTIKIGSKDVQLSHSVTKRVPLMFLYGLLINGPFTHYAYKLLHLAYRPPLGPRKRLAQILTSMATITPAISALMISYISLISNIDITNIKDLSSAKAELLDVLRKIKVALQTSLVSVIRSSWVSSPIFMLVAQSFLKPNQWAVFFNFCYFVLGTYNNTIIKRRLKEQNKNE
ncbi:hypothetical protein KL905_003662 [Ogataea polymorpha]|uniref:Peroxisomal membrane protein PMP22 n=1 Tax=Ogataea polymorpha TaxID=460523 RepID=A0A9P8NUQ6_9ASCO|nr:hypothetical protein KL908_003610 [Ogataea polymorpha]KAG7904478.1 hypothetical protein KL907_003354 [Ogataea polymorpha]KAG7919797.1 hypothetical protein KL905_003662 [Ogataea polymorpha]KAH3659890.1 hypothetical protein OGATHE_005935 [Ogataea polymorpha]